MEWCVGDLFCLLTALWILKGTFQGDSAKNENISNRCEEHRDLQTGHVTDKTKLNASL